MNNSIDKKNNNETLNLVDELSSFAHILNNLEFPFLVNGQEINLEKSSTFFLYNLANRTTYAVDTKLQTIHYFTDDEFSSMEVNSDFLHNIIETEKKREEEYKSIIKFNTSNDSKIEISSEFLSQIRFLEIYSMNRVPNNNIDNIYNVDLSGSTEPIEYINMQTGQKITKINNDKWSIDTKLKQEIILTSQQMITKLSYLGTPLPSSSLNIEKKLKYNP